MKILIIITISVLISFKPGCLPAQDRINSLSLKNVVDLAINQSPSVRYTQNSNVNYYWRYKNYQTMFRPMLVISGDLPNYTHTTQPVTQPDGSIQFKQVSNMLASSTLSLSQRIPLLGTSIYAASSLSRVQDFKTNAVDFSGAPLVVGFHQPLFAYNSMKWYRKTEPLIYGEAQRRYIESIESISYVATIRFFRYLKVQTDYNLAKSNLENSLNNLKIAETKSSLGQISENDLSRIRLSVLNARKALNTAEMELKNADFELKSYIGLTQDVAIELLLPLNMILFDIDVDKALEEAKENRKETLSFERRLIEANEQLTQAKRSNSLSATLTGSFGTSNNAPLVGDVYENPERQKVFQLSLSVPILDWGRSASQVKLAESRRELTIYEVEREEMDFEREIVVQVEQFSLLHDQLLTAKEADNVAESGYLIALKKFQNGEITITEMNIFLSERERAKRDYIASLESYWSAYYKLRILTLYDFELDKKISYGNPMLNKE